LPSIRRGDRRTSSSVSEKLGKISKLNLRKRWSVRPNDLSTEAIGNLLTKLL